MDNIYLILVVILFFLAISDLIVGVSNDAVNFLNSAIGSKAAPYRVILFVASIGIFIGATFSTGMMEVARNGIFNPQYFYFKEMIIIFLAVMITDVILLDLFNTLGLPTSTTVSLVSELMGAAVAVSIFKIAEGNQTIIVEGVEKIAQIGDYINTAKSLGIITGILASVIIAFTAGIIIQYFIRLIFSFNYQPRLKFLGSFFGGIAITSITYFLLIKGAKDAVFMSTETKAWIANNSSLIIFYSLIGWTIIIQIFKFVFKINELKLIVLAGTFALAMAFAGNDLVNFIGVPIAGFNSYEFFIHTPGATSSTFLMTSMAGENAVSVPAYMLVAAGLIMVLTIWFSKKAQRVSKTEIDLSRQTEGEERFGSSFLARSIVRGTIQASRSVERFMPVALKRVIDKQFDSSEVENKNADQSKDAPSFDLLRASVNLVVSSILISIATSYKLPLSTTYVTFMVAMGSSLSDRSWGRESAVYRVTGVLSVIGGWFFTAFLAFTGAFVFATLIKWFDYWAIFGLVLLAIYFIYHTHVLLKRKDALEHNLKNVELDEIDGALQAGTILKKCKNNVNDVLNKVIKLYNESIIGFEAEDRKQLKHLGKEVEIINAKTKELRHHIYPTVKKLQEDYIDSSLYYVQVVDYLRESAHCLTYISTPFYEHLNNNHKVFSSEQFEDLKGVRLLLTEFISKSIEMISSDSFDNLPNHLQIQQQLLDQLRLLRKKQLKRIKKEKASTRLSLLYLNLLHETQNLVLHVGNLLKAQRDFITNES